MAKKECVNKFENEQDCPCGEFDCERHGICCECLEFHRRRGEKPACFNGI